MKPILVTITIIVAVVGIVGISYFTNFDANQVPTGLIDSIPIERIGSDNYDVSVTNFVLQIMKL